jgi:hypothetical protein
MLTFFQGKKIYFIAAAWLAYAWCGVAIGKLTPEQAMDHTFEALTIAGFRSALKTEAAKVEGGSP